MCSWGFITRVTLFRGMYGRAGADTCNAQMLFWSGCVPTSRKSHLIFMGGGISTVSHRWMVLIAKLCGAVLARICDTGI